MNKGVAIILERMESHPEEFYGEEKKWAFVYKEYFRDVMTETERGMLFEKLKQLRRNEFEARVIQTLLIKEEEEETEEDWDPFEVPVKREGQTVKYDSSSRYVWRKEKDNGRK